MSRQARKISQTGYIILFLEELTEKNIFEENRDYKKLLEIIKEVKKIGFKIYVYAQTNL